MAPGADGTSAYLYKTLRATAWVTLVVLCMLVGYNAMWAIVPVVAGVALGIAMLMSLRWFVPRVLPADLAKKNQNASGKRGAFLLFALVKYPLVAAFIWWIVRHWESREVMAMAGGFILLQAVIGLRAVGRAMTESS